jgi:sugar lactone lactonase YvrE
MHDKLVGGALALSIGVCAAGAVQAQQAEQQEVRQVEPFPVAAEVVQVVKQFDNPEGAIFSQDGAHVFISNAAEIGDRGETFGWTEEEGYISKLAVQEDGTLEMVEEKLIAGLTGPLGMAVLPVATETFPEGTIFALSGSAPMVDPEGQVITEPERLRTKISGFDPESGEVLGEIDTGQGSVFEEINGSPIVLSNAAGFDQEGNLYVADTGFGADQFDPPFEAKGGLWMIPHGSIDALAAGESPDDGPKFIAIPGNPDGVEVSPVDGRIYVNTVGPVAGAPDPANGGIYALTRDDFTGEAASEGKLPPPVDQDLGALDGLDFTAGGLMLNTQIKPDVDVAIYVNCPDQPAQKLEISNGEQAELSGPADVAVLRSESGEQLVVVPELMNRSANTGDNEVTVLRLLVDFDQACNG